MKLLIHPQTSTVQLLIYTPQFKLIYISKRAVLPQQNASKAHDDAIKWKHFPRYWPFARGIHRSPVYSSHKGQWRGALIFSLTCVWINGWANNREAGALRRPRGHYDVTVMKTACILYGTLISSILHPHPHSPFTLIPQLQLHHQFQCTSWAPFY